MAFFEIDRYEGFVSDPDRDENQDLKLMELLKNLVDYNGSSLYEYL